MINWDRVDILREEVGADAFSEIVTMFLEEIDLVIAQLGRDRAQGRIEQDLHFLKGGALNLGFDRLGLLCEEREHLAAQAQGDAVNIDAILQVYEVSRREFLERLQVAAAA